MAERGCQIYSNALSMRSSRCRIILFKRYAGFGLEDRQDGVGRDELVQFRFLLLGQSCILHFAGQFGVVHLFIGGEIEREDISGMIVRKATPLRVDKGQITGSGSVIW